VTCQRCVGCADARTTTSKRKMCMAGEVIYRELERQILIGILRPRERLIEAELCRKLGVSRPLLREVFRRLEGVGLVSLTPNRGALVRDFSETEIEQIYFVRSVMETAASSLIIERVTSKDLVEIRALNQDFEEAFHAADVPGLISSNLLFHRRIWEISDNPFLVRFLQVSQLHTDQLRFVIWLDKERAEKSVKEHREMLSALAAKDRARYRKVVDSHLEGGKAAYRRILGSGGKWKRQDTERE
jgi:DNA-binding GntR family transcriptional regulator